MESTCHVVELFQSKQKGKTRQKKKNSNVFQSSFTIQKSHARLNSKYECINKIRCVCGGKKILYILHLKLFSVVISAVAAAILATAAEKENQFEQSDKAKEKLYNSINILLAIFLTFSCTIYLKMQFFG